MSTTRPPLPLAQAVPIVKGQAPAGMIQAEADLLNAWLAQHGSEYDSVTYNLRVGHGYDPGPTASDADRRNAIMNSQRRLDAVLMQGTHATIIEVKVRGSLHALGQLLGYRVLWMRDNSFVGLPKLLLLCSTIDADAMYVYSILGVPFTIVQQPAGGAALPSQP